MTHVKKFLFVILALMTNLSMFSGQAAQSTKDFNWADFYADELVRLDSFVQVLQQENGMDATKLIPYLQKARAYMDGSENVCCGIQYEDVKMVNHIIYSNGKSFEDKKKKLMLCVYKAKVDAALIVPVLAGVTTYFLWGISLLERSLGGQGFIPPKLGSPDRADWIKKNGGQSRTMIMQYVGAGILASSLVLGCADLCLWAMIRM